MVEGAYYFAGWQSAHIEHMLTDSIDLNEQKLFLDRYLSCLRPEIVDALQEHADSLFKPPVATLVKSFKQET